MRVFVTGAAGFIGRATVEELVKNGHQVLGLARSDANIEKITKAGGEPHKGSLEDLESLRSGARAADGVIHLAFIHDFQNLAHATAVDRAAIEAIGEVLSGTSKPLIISAGTLMLPKGVLATEDTEDEKVGPFAERLKSAEIISTLSNEKQVRGMVMRFAPTVHGAGDWGFVPILTNMCREKGSAVYIGDGSNRWPAVHRADAAVLLRLALEKGRPGATYHAVAEEGVAMKDIMTVIAKHLNLPMEGKSAEEAAAVYGFFAHPVGADNPTSSEKTQKELGWRPVQSGLLADMEANYFS